MTEGTKARIDRVLSRLPLPEPPPIEVAGSERRSLEELQAFYRVPGVSIAVVNQGEIEWARGVGVLDAATRTPVSSESIFQACSISKHVAACGALRLVEDGTLELDADISEYLTSWTLPANNGWQPRVTVRQLLGHTAGLTYAWFRGFIRGEPTPTLAQVLKGESPANTPPVRSVFPPGAHFRYSGSHYVVLQQIMQDVTGEAFPGLMHELIFGPLGMTNSSFAQDYPETRPDTTASNHYIDGQPVKYATGVDIRIRADELVTATVTLVA